RGQGAAARGLRDDPGAAPASLAGADAERRGNRRGDGGRGRGAAAPSGRPARLLRWAGRLMSDRRTETRSAAETEAVGARLAERLAPGDVVVVSGEVGAGKTTLIRGAARALGVVEPVTSPTFTIGQRYAGGRLPISHLDLYRLEDMEGEDPALL